MPAAAFSSRVNLREMATAAIAFMGWTGNGMPKAMPVSMLAAPVKSNVAGREMELEMTRAVMRGKRVPRSPSEPESSARGAATKVSTLCLWAFRRRVQDNMVTTRAQKARRHDLTNADRKQGRVSICRGEIPSTPKVGWGPRPSRNVRGEC